MKFVRTQGFVSFCTGVSQLCHFMQAVVDLPDEIRRVMPFKRLILTDFKCELTRLAKKKELKAALEESGQQPCSSGNHVTGSYLHPRAEEQLLGYTNAFVCLHKSAFVTT